MQAQIPPTINTDVRSSILMPPYHSLRLSRSIICDSASGSCASTAQAALRACKSLDDADAALADGMPLDVAAVDLSAALDALGEITGETLREGVLDEIFSRFCVGK